MNTHPNHSIRSRLSHWSSRALMAIVTIGAALSSVPTAMADDGENHHGGGKHWVATWATSPAAYFVYASPVPQNPKQKSQPDMSGLASCNKTVMMITYS